MGTHASLTDSPSSPALSNAEIADQLASLAQLLSTQKENPYKVKAYRRASASIRTLSESIDELVREEADLTRFEGIGEAISSAIREIVLTGSLGNSKNSDPPPAPLSRAASAPIPVSTPNGFCVFARSSISALSKGCARISIAAPSKMPLDSAWPSMSARA